MAGAFAPPARHLLRAKDLADARYFEPLGVTEMARAAGLSRAHFSREFRRDRGAPWPIGAPGFDWLTTRFGVLSARGRTARLPDPAEPSNGRGTHGMTTLGRAKPPGRR